MCKWKVNELPAVSPAIGRNQDGSFKTASLKEYPKQLSKGLAQTTIDALLGDFRAGNWRIGADSGRALLDWCDKALAMTEKIDAEATMKPDFQGW